MVTIGERTEKFHDHADLASSHWIHRILSYDTGSDFLNEETGAELETPRTESSGGARNSAHRVICITIHVIRPCSLQEKAGSRCGKKNSKAVFGCNKQRSDMMHFTTGVCKERQKVC